MPDATETRRYCERSVTPPCYAESAIESYLDSVWNVQEPDDVCSALMIMTGLSKAVFNHRKSPHDHREIESLPRR